MFNALKYGASGYLLKGVSVPELTGAIRTVVSGGAMINPGIVTKVVKFFNQMAQGSSAVETNSAAEGLSRTERNIAHLVGHGLSNKEIAEKLTITSHTVKAHIASIYEKLNVSNRVQATVKYLQMVNIDNKN